MTPDSSPEAPSAKTPKSGGKADAKLSYEGARDELTDVVNKLEAGGTTLEESISLWERGEVLAAICQEWLDGARAKLESIKPTP